MEFITTHKPIHRKIRKPRKSIFFDEDISYPANHKYAESSLSHSNRKCTATPAANHAMNNAARLRGAENYQHGIFGEEVIADQLKRSGWNLLAHRVSTRVGEIDLVARRGETIIFAEVKSANTRSVNADQVLGSRQRHRIRKAAIAWITSNPSEQNGVKNYRFDVFFVQRDQHEVITRIDHVRDAF